MGDHCTNDILKWYGKNKRDLPWRQTRDPYAILVSEMMLCQTTVDTVLKYYDKFMARFPDVSALASASEDAVLSAWQGLGYYSRTRHLHEAAKQTAIAGTFPQTYEALKALPGIGDYIAGAVMSIAYDAPYPAVDGNVMRVIARLDGIAEDITSPSVRRQIARRVQEMMPPQNRGDFTQALMEMGALVCRPVSPDCAACPIRPQCKAYRQGIADKLPVKKPKSRPSTVNLWAVAVTTPRALLLEYRVNETLLKRMWGLPVIEKENGKTPEMLMSQKYAITLENGEMAGHVTHVFTHRRWEMDVIRFRLRKEAPVKGLEWVGWDELKDKPIPTAFQKVMDVLKKDDERNGA